MAKVTGLTAERMLEIEAASVVAGAVDLNNHLILTTHNGIEIDAGYVKGAAGKDGTNATALLTVANTQTVNLSLSGAGTTPSPWVLRAETSEVPPGTISQYAGGTAPTGYLFCNGTLVSRTTYPRLFVAIGTTYGAGDGSTTFMLPNLKGRVPVGFDSSQSEFNTLNKSGGAKTHTLTSTEMPSHTHVQNAHAHLTGISQTQAYGAGPYGSATAAVSHAPVASYTSDATPTNQSTGGGVAHNNLQPFITLNYMIRY